MYPCWREMSALLLPSTGVPANRSFDSDAQRRPFASLRSLSRWSALNSDVRSQDCLLSKLSCVVFAERGRMQKMRPALLRKVRSGSQ